MQRGWSPVHFAASIGHAEVLLTLLRAKADVDLQTEVRHGLALPGTSCATKRSIDILPDYTVVYRFVTIEGTSVGLTRER